MEIYKIYLGENKDLDTYLLRVIYILPPEIDSDNDYFNITMKIWNCTLRDRLEVSWHKIYSENYVIDYAKYIFIITFGLFLHYLSTASFTQISASNVKLWKKEAMYSGNVDYLLISVALLLFLEYMMDDLLKLIPNNIMAVFGGCLLSFNFQYFCTILIKMPSCLKSKFHWIYFWTLFTCLLVFLLYTERMWLFDNIFFNLPTIITILPIFQLTSIYQYIPTMITAVFHSFWLSSEFQTNKVQNIFLYLLHSHTFSVRTTRNSPLNIWYSISLFQILVIIMLFQYLRRIEQYLNTRIYYRSAFICAICSLFLHDCFLMPYYPRKFPIQVRGVFLNLSLSIILVLIGLGRGELGILLEGRPFKQIFTESLEGKLRISKIDKYLKNYRFRYNRPTYILQETRTKLAFWDKLFYTTKRYHTHLKIKSFFPTERGYLAIHHLFLIKIFNYLKDTHVLTMPLKLSKKEKILEILYIKGRQQIITRSNLAVAIYTLTTGFKENLQRCKGSISINLLPCGNILFMSKPTEITRITFSANSRDTSTLKLDSPIAEIFGLGQNNFLTIDQHKQIQQGSLLNNSFTLLDNPHSIYKLENHNKYLYINEYNSVTLKIFKILGDQIELNSESEIGAKYFLVIASHLILTKYERERNTIIRIIDVNSSKCYLSQPFEQNIYRLVHKIKIL